MNRKLKLKLDSIIKVNERCLEGCDPPSQGVATVCDAREILVYPLPEKL